MALTQALFDLAYVEAAMGYKVSLAENMEPSQHVVTAVCAVTYGAESYWTLVELRSRIKGQINKLKQREERNAFRQKRL